MDRIAVLLPCYNSGNKQNGESGDKSKESGNKESEGWKKKAEDRWGMVLV